MSKNDFRRKGRIDHIGMPVVIAMLAFAPAAAQECVPAPDGLISWWSGDTDADDIEDGNAGTLTNGAWVAPGHIGGAFTFDGHDDMVVVPDSPTLRPSTAFTISAWVNFAASEGTLYGGATDFAGQNLQYIVHKRNSRSGGSFQSYGLTRRHQSVRFAARAADGSVTFFNVSSNTQPVQNGVWHHVVGTYDGTHSRLYLDGAVQSHAGDIPANGAALDHSSEPLVIGRSGQDGSNGLLAFDAAFVGSIDEVMLFDRALTAGEVAALYEADSLGACKDEDDDGFRPPFDCDEADASVNPDATELPGNFTDENCDGSLGDCDPCDSWKNHGEYVRCVAHGVDALVANGSLTEDDADELVTSAARSDIGKTGHSAPECAVP